MSRHSWGRDSWDVDPRLAGIQRDADGNDTIVSLTRRVATLQHQLDAVGDLVREPWAVDPTTRVA
jgi:hypothetical protein